MKIIISILLTTLMFLANYFTGNALYSVFDYTLVRIIIFIYLGVIFLISLFGFLALGKAQSGQLEDKIYSDKEKTSIHEGRAKLFTGLIKVIISFIVYLNLLNNFTVPIYYIFIFLIFYNLMPSKIFQKKEVTP